ncbi:alpha/beta-hydrolase [Apiospora aurea]|uniref:Alpha/beta-hydrolase n=1 Tax=Apiospora aurea TaxID=335848 RepID=A0ABR1PYV9_9PEZI
MTNNKPTIIIIGGGWHIPSSYSKLAGLLRSSGLEVHVPRLPTMNEARPPNADLATDTQFIRSYVESLVEAGRSVIAVTHSYGGQLGTNALAGLGLETRAKSGLQGGVSHLIYMCASAFLEGQTMIDKVKQFDHEQYMPVAFDFDAEDNTVVCRQPRATLIGDGQEGEADEAEIEAYLSYLVRWNGTCMYQPISHCAWREIPVSYIYTSGDMTLPLAYQESMVETLRKEGREVATVELSRTMAAWRPERMVPLLALVITFVLLYEFDFSVPQPPALLAPAIETYRKPKTRPPLRFTPPSGFNWSTAEPFFPAKPLTPLPKGPRQPLPMIQHDFGTHAHNDPITKGRRMAAREALVRLWDSYTKYAWLHDELKPVSAGFKNPFGPWRGGRRRRSTP